MTIVKITLFLTVLFLVLLTLMRMSLSKETRRKLALGLDVKLRLIDWLTVTVFLLWLFGIVLSAFCLIFG